MFKRLSTKLKRRNNHKYQWFNPHIYYFVYRLLDKLFKPISYLKFRYPNYRRRPTDLSYVTRNNFKLDKRWVVPHNLYLCTKYNAHINVELCNSVTAVKYFYKYVYKGLNILIRRNH